MSSSQASHLDKLLASLHNRKGPKIRLMEVCGTHTMSFFATGLRAAFSSAGIELISGPGCPVCVTAQQDIDLAQEFAQHPDVCLATFGDMLRVPGSTQTLAEARAAGANVKVVYSPLDAVGLAQRQPDQDVVFLAIGFETTAPGVAAAVIEAERLGLNNFYIYPLHKTVPPALQLIANDPRLKLDGFVCPGHVSVIIGASAYEPVAQASGRPCVVTGFELIDLALGVVELVRRIDEGEGGVFNAYPRVVTEHGNKQALALLDRVFKHECAVWRGLGRIEDSGLELQEHYSYFDVRQKHNRWPDYIGSPEMPGCQCGDILLGLIRPNECALFASDCTPLKPAGPCMVSKEGACHAYYKYLERGV